MKDMIKEKKTQRKGEEISMSNGDKFDKEKLRMDLVPPAAIKGLAYVLEMGAIKYGDYNWYKGVEYSRLYAACLRHLIAWWEGEDDDRESGLSHVDHAMCNLAFLSQFMQDARFELDDRPDYREVKSDKKDLLGS
jgi:hypothetical protein